MGVSVHKQGQGETHPASCSGYGVGVIEYLKCNSVVMVVVGVEVVYSKYIYYNEVYMLQCIRAYNKQFTPHYIYNTCWKHAVVPDVTLTFSNTMVKAGTSVNVTCTAQSYPPANLTSYYQLQHPSGVTVNAIYRTPEVDGVVHPIETVTSEDGGEYDCIVTVVVGSEQLQSDTIRASLTVYYGKSCKIMAMCYQVLYICGEYMHLDVYCFVTDPPYIKRVRNFTISLEPSVEQSAFVFECEVQIPEPDLEVWVDWIPADGKSIKTNATQRVGNVFFLAVFNVTKEDDDQLYVCQLFSVHSPDKSVDKRTASAQSGHLCYHYHCSMVYMTIIIICVFCCYRGYQYKCSRRYSDFTERNVAL